MLCLGVPGREGRPRREELLKLRVLAVADDGVARVEAHEHAARGVELKHAAQVHGEVRLALVHKLDEGYPAGAGLRGRERVAEADEARTRLGEDAEAVPTLAGLHAELHLL